jgi:hypothetical protein
VEEAEQQAPAMMSFVAYHYVTSISALLLETCHKKQEIRRVH